MSSSKIKSDQGLQDKLRALIVSGHEKFIVGLSGGLDSVVLLHALAHVIEPKKISAIYVNHNLHADSDDWASFCETYCSALQINCQIESVDILAKKKNNQTESIEELARNARYSIFEKYTEKNHLLLTAHHADDQVETFFLQLMRGSGSKGLQSMPLSKKFGKGLHMRPFLNTPKTELSKYAERHQLKHIEDSSNEDVRFDRNCIRHEVLPMLHDRWPEYQHSILTSIKNLKSERQTLLGLLKQLHPAFFQKQTLSINQLVNLDKNKKTILFRLWLEQYCDRLPPQIRIEEFLRQLTHIRNDTSAELRWLQHVVYVYKDALYFTYEWSNEQVHRWKKLPDTPFDKKLLLPNDMGHIEVVAKQFDDQFVIRFRQGGERLRLETNNFHSKLKNLLNDKAVFPWMRSRIPLIYAGDSLVAVADLWVNAEWLEQQEIHDFTVIWHNRPQITA